MITRTVTRDQLARWGIPFGNNSARQAEVLDVIELGGTDFTSFKQIIFVAPDDSRAYSVDYASGLAITEPFVGQPDEITLTWVRSNKRPVVVTDWLPVTQDYVDGVEVSAW